MENKHTWGEVEKRFSESPIGKSIQAYLTDAEYKILKSFLRQEIDIAIAEARCTCTDPAGNFSKYSQYSPAITWECPRCRRIHHMLKQTCDCPPPFTTGTGTNLNTKSI